jgi:hypothetical protein
MESGFSDFLSQIPLAPILLLVGFGTVFVLLLYVFMNRNRRSKDATPQAQASTVNSSIPQPLPATGDLPDLDSLLGIDLNAVPARKSTFSVKLQDGGTVEAAEVLIVLRDIATGDLIVEMNGKAYRDPKRIASNDPELQRRFTSALHELTTKSGIAAASTAEAAVAPSISQEMPIISADAPPDTESADMHLPDLQMLVGSGSAVNSTASTLPPGTLPGDLPSFKLPDTSPIEVKRGLLAAARSIKKQDLKPVPEINIAGAIEAYLQYKLANTVGWQERNIHVHPSKHGVRIQVETNFYEAVGDIEDPAVREFLASTIQEWQERN